MLRERFGAHAVYIPRGPRRLQACLVVACGFVAVLTLLITFDINRRGVSVAEWRNGLAEQSSQWAPSALKDLGTVSPPVLDNYGREIVLPTAKGRVLVTGGGGMIGKQVVKRLLRAKVPVTVLDVIFFEDELAAIRAEFPGSDLQYVRGDIRDTGDLAVAMTGVKGVINLAAVSRVMWCLENEPDCTDINVKGTQRVLEAMPSTAWFIQASSREVYGNPDHIPMAEDSPHNPANVYGKSKAEAEDVIITHVARATSSGGNKINAIMLRLSNVYGSAYDHPERLIPAIMRNALSNRPIQMVGGDQDLDMVYVEDVVDAMMHAVTRLHRKTFDSWIPRRGHLETFNVGTSTSTSAMTLIRKTLWLTNSSSPLRIIPGDDRFPSRYVGSTVKAANVLGYTARVGIDEGLHRLATAYLEKTVGFLKAKQDAEPFKCLTKKQYSVDDLVALNGCTGYLSVRNPKDGLPYYARIQWHKDMLLYAVNPEMFHFEVRKKGNGAASLTLSAIIPDKGAQVNYTWVPQEIFKGEIDAVDPKDGEFEATVEPETGYLRLTRPNGTLFIPDEELEEASNNGPKYIWRIAPICCLDKPAPWPFYRDEALASNVGDSRVRQKDDFDASQIKTMCTHLAEAEAYATARLDKLKATPQPIKLEERSLPTGRAPDWRMRQLPEVCNTLCDHPTFCVDTGNCMCGHAANCAPPPRFPWAKYANMPTLSYPTPSTDFTENTDGKTALEARVARSSWANVLSSDARRYLANSPEWPATTALHAIDKVEQFKTVNASDWYVVRNDEWGCFSADTVMDRAAHLISKPYTNESIVFMPFYQFNKFIKFPPLIESLDLGLSQLPPGAKPEDIVMTFTHDWSHCNNDRYNIQDQRNRYKEPTPKETRVTSWSPMGDLYSQCYQPDQDVVIPPRTCLQDQLREAYGDMSKVKPIRERSGLVAFKGRTYQIYGGSSQREKVICDRVVQPGRLEGGDKLERWWQRYKQGHDYVSTINETIFCPLPRGTTGWATRMNDVIYGGCIPVLITDRTHHIWWDVLDWSKIAVFVNEWDLERLEEILLSYSWDELEQMQANLMLVRDAFLYPAEGHMDENLHERGPFWFAMHSTWLLRQTRYPTIDDF